MDTDLKLHLIPITAVVMLLLGLFDMPYGYYTLLRIVVTFVAGWLAYFFYLEKKIIWAIILGLIAILFNPLIPIYMKKEEWVIVDIIAAVIFAISTFVFKTIDKE